MKTLNRIESLAQEAANHMADAYVIAQRTDVALAYYEAVYSGGHPDTLAMNLLDEAVRLAKRYKIDRNRLPKVVAYYS